MSVHPAECREVVIHATECHAIPGWVSSGISALTYEPTGVKSHTNFYRHQLDILMGEFLETHSEQSLRT